jgi:hypothetical protein
MEDSVNGLPSWSVARARRAKSNPSLVFAERLANSAARQHAAASVAQTTCLICLAALATLLNAIPSAAQETRLPQSAFVAPVLPENTAVADSDKLLERSIPSSDLNSNPRDASEAVVDEADDFRHAAGSITKQELDLHIRRMADDSLEGRESGSRGGRAAGNLLVEYFEQAGLQPMGDRGSYFQEFDPNYRNIIGFFPGSDPQLQHEFVMLGAHYDHVGYGTPRNSFGPVGYIHNGADDNGSGTAALLEVLQAFSMLKSRPARSVIFALWDGEEKGLLGSKDWVFNQLTDPNRIKLYVNMDMVGRLRDSKLEVYGTRSSVGLRRLVSELNLDQLNLDFNWKMREDSDHYSFWQRQVPAIMLHTGLHDQYHRPTDDPETINIDGVLKVSQLALRTIVAAADQESLGGFREASWSEGESARVRFEAFANPRPSRLGVKVVDGQQGVPALISEVVSGSAAAQAGLRAGDRIVSVNGGSVSNRIELLQTIRTSPVACSMVVIKSGEPKSSQVEVTLQGQPVRVGLSWRIDDADPSMVYVVNVDEGTPAGESGLQTGDRIYYINGQRYSGSDELSRIFKEAHGKVNLTVERMGQLQTLEMLLD